MYSLCELANRIPGGRDKLKDLPRIRLLGGVPSLCIVEQHALVGLSSHDGANMSTLESITHIRIGIECDVSTDLN